MSPNKIGIIIGTRPQIIKMAPFIKECARRQADYFVIDTGQHTAPAMQSEIYKALGLAESKYMLARYEYSETAYTIKGILQDEQPAEIHLHGDTDSTVIGALAAASLGLPITHHEAGLRAFTLWMREEQNRILVDHLSAYLCAPTEAATDNLERETVTGKICVTGNLIADVVKRPAARPAGLIHYALLTIHRRETVDNEKILADILTALAWIVSDCGLKIICPVHPRTADRLAHFKLSWPAGVDVIEPQPFNKFYELEAGASFILTDSGGVQEEAAIMGVPCVTLRGSTERPETVEIGANVLAGNLPMNIVHAAKMALLINYTWPNPYGENVAQKTFDAWRGAKGGEV